MPSNNPRNNELDLLPTFGSQLWEIPEKFKTYLEVNSNENKS